MSKRSVHIVGNSEGGLRTSNMGDGRRVYTKTITLEGIRKKFNIPDDADITVLLDGATQRLEAGIKNLQAEWERIF